MNVQRKGMFHPPGSQGRDGRTPSASLFGRQNNLLTVVLAMVVLVPLVTGTDFLTSAGKALTFEVLGTLLLSLMIAQLRLRGAVDNAKKNVMAGPNLAIVAVVAFSAISFVMAPHKAFALPELLRVAFCALVYFAVAYSVRGRLQQVMDTLLFVTAAVSLIGLVNIGIGGYSDPSHVTASFGTHELLGSFLMLVLPITIALSLFQKKDQNRQIAAQVVTVLAASTLLMARTRSAWFGEAAALVVLTVLALRAYPAVNKLATRKHMLIGPAVVIAIAVAMFVLASNSGSMIGSRAASVGSASQDSSVVTRIDMARGAVKAFESAPLFGHGLGMYPVIAGNFTKQAASMPFVLRHGSDLRNNAHNFYLQTAAETGVIGLGLYLAMLAAFFVAGIRGLRKQENGLRKAVLIGCLAAMAGQVVDAIGSPSYNFASVSLFQWVIMAIGMYTAGVTVPAAEAAPVAEENVTFSVSARKGLARVVAAAVCLTLLVQIIPTAGTTQADAYSSSNNTGTDILVGVGIAGLAYYAIATAKHHDDEGMAEGAKSDIPAPNAGLTAVAPPP